MYRIKEFMRPRTFEESDGNITIMPENINPKFTAARNYVVPACESFMSEISKKRYTNTKKVKTLSEKEGYLSQDKIEVGYFVSTDQLVCKNPSRLPTSYGRE